MAKRICIMNHTASSAHLGCRTAMYILERLLRIKFGADTEFERLYVDVKESDFIRISDVTSRAGARRAVEGWGEVKATIDKCDLVILNGEGTLHWNGGVGNWRSWLWLSLALYALESGRELWITNTSVFSDNSEYMSLVRDVFQGASYAAIRDIYSLQDETAGSSAVRSSDLSLLVPSCFEPEVRAQLEKRYETLSGNEPLLVFAGSSAVNGGNSNQWYSMFRAVLQSWSGRSLFLLQSPWFRDRNIANVLKSEFPEMAILDHVPAPSESVFLLGNAAVVLSGRFHVNTLSFAAGTPVISLPGNTLKNKSLVKMADCGGMVYSEVNAVSDIIASTRALAGMKIGADVQGHMRRMALLNVPDCNVCDFEGNVSVGELERQEEFNMFCDEIRADRNPE